MMESKKLAALVSSLISQVLLLLLLHLFPSSTPLSLAPHSDSSNFFFNSTYYSSLFPLIRHFLSSQDIAVSLSLLPISRKRKRTHFPESDSEPTHEDGDEGIGHRLSEFGRAARNPDSFRNSFKMNSSTFEWLAGLLEPLLDCRDPIGSRINLSAELRLGIGLSRLATGSNYSEIAYRFGVSESVTRFCAKQLCRVLCTNFRFWIAFPTPSELELVSRDFEALTGLPNCCGVIDCTRFKISGPADWLLASQEIIHDDSVAAQIVVDSSSRILSIVAGFRGDKGDSRILKSTTLYRDIEEGRLLSSNPIIVNGVAINQYLVGDGEYPLLPWLMVPFRDDTPGSCEEKFNAANDSMCVSALRTISSLKSWGVLSKPIQEEFKTAVAFIGACSILHNALLMREDDSALLDVEDYAIYGQGSQHCGDSIVEENLTDSRAAGIRNVLAKNVRGFRTF